MNRSEDFMWPTSFMSVACDHCAQAFLSDESAASAHCPTCHQGELKPFDDSSDQANPLPPELVVPFSVSAETINQSLTRFANRYYFTPADFTIANLQTRLQRVYLPMFLVDSTVETDWQAELGFNYDVVSHDEVYRNNKWHTVEKTETRIRWEPRVGTLNRHYDNIRAPALSDHNNIVDPLGKFKLWETEVYQPQHLGNAFIRLPNRSTSDAWAEAEPSFLQLAEKDVEKACDGQHIRQFKWQPNYSQQYWSKLLLPVYSSYYQDDAGKRVPVLIHGRTGQVIGRQVASLNKAKRLSIILGIIAVALFISYLLLFRFSAFAQTPLVFFLALIIGLAAIAPVAYVTNLNQSNKNDFL